VRWAARAPASALHHAAENISRTLKIYPLFYPLWGIAFVRVFGYSDFREESLVSATTFPGRSSMSDMCAGMYGKWPVPSKDGACLHTTWEIKGDYHAP